ncbi:MAG: HD domain-containing protein [Candidatus Shapirobacteria bacterium]|jgi:putative nucleotidyltransferase with HDIG domain
MPGRIKSLRAGVENYALKFLEQGRSGWDIKHTRAVAFYAEKIALSEGLDAEVLYTAAWLHDVGYYGLFENSDSTQHSQIMDKKLLHMTNGAKLARAFFQMSEITPLYTTEQIEEIIHLVEVHDNLEVVGKSREETVLVEADTLGAIDLQRLSPTFKKEDGLKYIDGLKKKRIPKFKTDLGKQFLSKLLPAFIEYFEKMES